VAIVRGGACPRASSAQGMRVGFVAKSLLRPHGEKENGRGQRQSPSAHLSSRPAWRRRRPSRQRDRPDVALCRRWLGHAQRGAGARLCLCKPVRRWCPSCGVERPGPRVGSRSARSTHAAQLHEKQHSRRDFSVGDDAGVCASSSPLLLLDHYGTPHDADESLGARPHEQRPAG
jgi:hypothetical protein